MLRRSTLAGGILAATALTGGAVATGPSASAAEAPTHQASSSAKTQMKFPCGFSFLKQTYKNCSDKNVLVVVSAHDSTFNKWTQIEHCVKPGKRQTPLAPYGMLAYGATGLDKNGPC